MRSSIRNTEVIIEIDDGEVKFVVVRCKGEAGSPAQRVHGLAALLSIGAKLRDNSEAKEASTPNWVSI